ncbi:Hypothetical_protein [Hexamita inflata]|uniref:Hypothetical_protein n=1 Tax=Hexamita inflata TaxID=28002 RepID=A0AA86RUF6_9EUKA|nr:Hypothetical protein HINF_LOCUS60430 [Hexamita inflata]
MLLEPIIESLIKQIIVLYRKPLIQSCSSSMKKSFKQNNQSFRSQKQTEHNKKNKQNNLSNTEQNKPKGSKQNQSKKNQIKELVKSFNKILNGNQKPKGNSFTGQQNHQNNEQQLIKIHTSTSNNVR